MAIREINAIIIMLPSHATLKKKFGSRGLMSTRKSVNRLEKLTTILFVRKLTWVFKSIVQHIR